jgi:predicted nuclease of predicted toxin-antitoxin system
MKLLFDQNISYRLVKRIKEFFPEAKQVRELNLENKTDRQIWDFAKKNGYTIVTFDIDFYDLSNLLGLPPKVILLKTGNRKTIELSEILSSKVDIISEFLTKTQYSDLGCLEIDN